MKLRCQGCEEAKLAFEPLTSSHKQIIRINTCITFT